MMNRRLLLLSSSRSEGKAYLEHARETIRDFLGNTIKRILFIPYARVMPSFGEYASVVRQSFREIGYKVNSTHETAFQEKAVMCAEAIVVGGGNTFFLLHNLYERGLLECIRDRAGKGVPYIGWSAGSNITGPTIRTTNDMPVIQPRSFKALGLVPFQINPHYTDARPPGLMGETRAERIAEFLELNPDVPVVGMKDGSILRIEGNTAALLRDDIWVFRKGKERASFTPGDSVDSLLKES